MKPHELLKLVLSGRFFVARVAKAKDGNFVIKQMPAYGYPTWVVWEKVKAEDVNFHLSMLSGGVGGKKLFLVKPKLAYEDLDNLCEAGFSVYKGVNNELLKKYAAATHGWRIVERFKRGGSGNQYYQRISELEQDKRSVVVS
jgi:hypothetical protein